MKVEIEISDEQLENVVAKRVAKKAEEIALEMIAEKAHNLVENAVTSYFDDAHRMQAVALVKRKIIDAASEQIARQFVWYGQHKYTSEDKDIRDAFSQGVLAAYIQISDACSKPDAEFMDNIAKWTGRYMVMKVRKTKRLRKQIADEILNSDRWTDETEE